jgi:16S rRNA (cytidine1402-2'-O)-methyltransferase
VLVVAGAARREQALDAAAEHTLRILLEDLPLKQAAALAARLTGLKKNLLYDVALGWQSGKV